MATLKNQLENEADHLIQLYTPKRVSIENISQISEQARLMLEDVRDSMLQPHPRKNPPVYSGTQLAALCGIDRKRQQYLASRGDLPSGEMVKNRRLFSLQDVRQWVAHEANIPARPKGAKGKKIAVANFKGGVSKTTTTLTLAQGLSLRGRRCLVIDIDPQASLTTLFGILPESEVDKADDTILPVIYGTEPDLRYAIRKTYWDGIDLVPSHIGISDAEFFLPNEQAKALQEKRPFEFWNALNKGLEPLLDEYDVILFDTPPALSYTTINALMAADGLIVPTPPNALDYASSTQFWSLFSDFTTSVSANNRVHKSFDFVNVLLTKVEEKKVATSIVREWIRQTYGDKVLPVEIPDTTVTSNAAAEFGTVYDISRYEGSLKTYLRAREAYDKFAEIIDLQLLALWLSSNKD